MPTIDPLSSTWRSQETPWAHHWYLDLQTNYCILYEEKSISQIQVDPFVSRTWGTGSHLYLQAMLEISTSHLDVAWPSRDLTLSSPVGVTLKVDRPIQLRQVKKTDITRFCQVTHYRGYPCVTICFARCETTWVPPILVYYSIYKYRSFWFAALYWLDVLASLWHIL